MVRGEVTCLKSLNKSVAGLRSNWLPRRCVSNGGCCLICPHPQPRGWPATLVRGPEAFPTTLQ